MTCKDCLHFEVCDSGRHIGEYEVDDGVYSDGVEKECPMFKNKDDYAEVKHGKWLDDIKEIMPLNGNILRKALVGYRCSECGRPEFNREPYCNCGAKMDGGS